MSFKDTLSQHFKEHLNTSKKSVANNMMIALSFTTFLFIASIAIIILFFADMNNYSTLINDTGKIRGGIQRALKLEVANAPDEAALPDIDRLLSEAQQSERKIRLKHESFSIYSSLLSLLNTRWQTLKEDILLYREGEISAGELLRRSEEIWHLSNEAVGAIEKTAHVRIITFYVFAIIGVVGTVSLVGILVATKYYVRDRIEYFASHDQLTKLYNRHFFDAVLDREILLSSRQENRFAILMCDIDHFKSVNDSFGHVTGDQALKEVARIIRENSRASDVVARFGGEEFVILAKGGDENGNFAYAERIRKAVEKARIADGLQLTISIGVSNYENGTTKIRMLEKADEALYRAKAGGRNQTAMQTSDGASRPVSTC